MKKFLITRPTHEIRVTYLFHWGKEILEFAKKKSINFTDFKNGKANRKDVEKYLKKQNPRLVLFNGHGNTSMICGHDDEPLIISNENEDLLNSKITYAIVCDAAKKLGKNAVKKGCDAFIGYEGPFGFVRDASRECNPFKDKFAEPFKEISNIIVTSLLKGDSVEESVEKSKHLTSELIKKYSTSDAEPGFKDIRFWLFWDKFFLNFIGDPTAKF